MGTPTRIQDWATYGGVIVHPSDLEAAGMKIGDEVEATATGGVLVITRAAAPRCCVCGATESLATFGRSPVRRICVRCAVELTTGTLVFSG